MDSSADAETGHGSSAADPFAEAVDEVLRALRPGEVVTYGEVAAEAGRPGAARAVGRLLSTSGGAYPWWRVVTASGRLVPGGEAEHERRLTEEGVAVVDGRVRVAARRSGRAGRSGRSGRSDRESERPDGS